MNDLPPDWPCLRRTRRGLELAVHVQPNASRTAVAGLQADALRVRLAAPALEGRANAALIEWLADALGLPRRRVSLVTGEKSRHKQLLIDADEAQVASRLASIVKDRAPPGR